MEPLAKASSLKALSLCGNKIEKTEELKALSNLSLVQLDLEGNPVEKESKYKETIFEMF